jgi:hypothetical protein
MTPAFGSNRAVSQNPESLSLLTSVIIGIFMISVRPDELRLIEPAPFAIILASPPALTEVLSLPILHAKTTTGFSKKGSTSRLVQDFRRLK